MKLGPDGRLLATVLVTGLAIAACGPAVKLDDPNPFDEDDPAAMPEGVESGRRQSDDGALVETAPVRRGQRQLTVSRTSLDAVLAQGPGVFLRGVEIKPHFQNERFQGWEIVQFMPGESRFDDIDIRPGDIIRHVNTHRIARPQHLAALWSELGKADSIVVEVVRAGYPFELRFEVTDDAKATAP